MSKASYPDKIMNVDNPTVDRADDSDGFKETAGQDLERSVRR